MNLKDLQQMRVGMKLRLTTADDAVIDGYLHGIFPTHVPDTNTIDEHIKFYSDPFNYRIFLVDAEDDKIFHNIMVKYLSSVESLINDK